MNYYMPSEASLTFDTYLFVSFSHLPVHADTYIYDATRIEMEQQLMRDIINGSSLIGNIVKSTTQKKGPFSTTIKVCV